MDIDIQEDLGAARAYAEDLSLQGRHAGASRVLGLVAEIERLYSIAIEQQEKASRPPDMSPLVTQSQLDELKRDIAASFAARDREQEAHDEAAGEVDDDLAALVSRMDNLEGHVRPAAWFDERGEEARELAQAIVRASMGPGGAFLPGLGTLRACIDCGAVVAGGPTRCCRCAQGDVGRTDELRMRIGGAERSVAVLEQVVASCEKAITNVSARGDRHDADIERLSDRFDNLESEHRIAAPVTSAERARFDRAVHDMDRMKGAVAELERLQRDRGDTIAGIVARLNGDQDRIGSLEKRADMAVTSINDVFDRLDHRLDAMKKAAADSDHHRAVARERIDGLVRDVSDMLTTLHGPEGDTGLVDDVHSLEEQIPGLAERLRKVESGDHGLAAVWQQISKWIDDLAAQSQRLSGQVSQISTLRERVDELGVAVSKEIGNLDDHRQRIDDVLARHAVAGGDDRAAVLALARRVHTLEHPLGEPTVRIQSVVVPGEDPDRWVRGLAEEAAKRAKGDVSAWATERAASAVGQPLEVGHALTKNGDGRTCWALLCISDKSEILGWGLYSEDEGGITCGAHVRYARLCEAKAATFGEARKMAAEQVRYWYPFLGEPTR